MPAKLSVAMSKETAPPEYASLGVTCSLEFDDDLPTLQNLETFQHAVHSAILVCQEGLREESVRQT